MEVGISSGKSGTDEMRVSRHQSGRHWFRLPVTRTQSHRRECMQSTTQSAFFTQARAQVADSSSFLIQATSSSLVSCSRSSSNSMHHAYHLIHDIRKWTGARYGCFSLGSGFRTASIAAVGSTSTPKRPMPGISWGPTGILAPSFPARAIVASTSSTAT